MSFPTPFLCAYQKKIDNAEKDCDNPPLDFPSDEAGEMGFLVIDAQSLYRDEPVYSPRRREYVNDTCSNIFGCMFCSVQFKLVMLFDPAAIWINYVVWFEPAHTAASR